MNKEMLKNVLLALCAAVAIFCAFKYLTGLKEKYDLQLSVGQLKQQVNLLESQKQGLAEELAKAKESEAKIAAKLDGLKHYFHASKQRMGKLFTDLDNARKAIEDLDSKINLLKSENNALRGEKQALAQDNETLRTKLNSITQLKKAIKELRGQINNVSKEIKKTIKEEKLIEGNRGFLIKEGKPTYPTKVKIEVTPLPQGQ